MADALLVMDEATRPPFALLLGRKTYEIFAVHWPHASDDQGGKLFNEARKYVASRMLRSVDWTNSVLIEGDVAKAGVALKKAAKRRVSRWMTVVAER